MARDIAKRLAAEQALQESEKRYRDLIESQGDGVVLGVRRSAFHFCELGG
jgi:PAS domain-containing protein